MKLIKFLLLLILIALSHQGCPGDKPENSERRDNLPENQVAGLKQICLQKIGTHFTLSLKRQSDQKRIRFTRVDCKYMHFTNLMRNENFHECCCGLNRSWETKFKRRRH